MTQTRLGRLILAKLNSWSSQYERTSQLDNSDRLYGMRDGAQAGYWFRPSQLPAPSSVPASSITGQLSDSQIAALAATKLTGTINNDRLGGSIPRDKLLTPDGQDASTSSVSVTSTSSALCYTFSSLGSSRADADQILWGFSVGGYTSMDSTFGTLQIKTLRAYARIKVNGTVKATTGEYVVAGAGTRDYALGAGTTSDTIVLTSPGGGTVSIEIFARINIESGSPSVDGELLHARGWWIEV